MNDIVFLKVQFWLLIVSSLLIPAWMCWYMLSRRATSRRVVLAFGILMILLAGLDLILLPILFQEAKQSKSTADDVVFASSYSVALYLLPLISAGLGVNLIGHCLRSRLKFAEITDSAP
jgi:hypothetical protein